MISNTEETIATDNTCTIENIKLSLNNCNSSAQEIKKIVQESGGNEISLSSSSCEVRLIEKFITASQCDYLIEKFSKDCIDSKIESSQNTEDVQYFNSDIKVRSSTSAYMNQRGKDVVLMEITEKVANLCNLPISHVEGLQLVRYQKGQQYIPHHDYFKCNFKGQNRIFTVLIYLNDLEPEDGGRTIFPALNIKVIPKTGNAVFWRNCLDDCTLLPDSLHTGEIIHRDNKIKYAVNCWIRNGPVAY
jgi:prolyl 4-hydroxylase